MPTLPQHRPFDGVALLAVFSDARARQLVDGVLDYSDWHRLNQLLDQAGGQALELSNTQVLAVFRSAREAWQAAQALLAAVLAIRQENPVRRLLSAQLLLDAGSCQLDGKTLKASFAPLSAAGLAAVPLQGVGGSAALLALLRREGLEPPASKPLAPQLWLLLAPEDESETRLASETTLADTGLFTSIGLRLRGEDLEVPASRCPVRLGRDAQCELRLNGDKVSRIHGRIEFDHGKFLYVDGSKNGSYVLTGAGEELLIQQGESLILIGDGAISPGLPLAQQTGDVVRYRCRPSKLKLEEPGAGDTMRLPTRT